MYEDFIKKMVEAHNKRAKENPSLGLKILTVEGIEKIRQEKLEKLLEESKPKQEKVEEEKEVEAPKVILSIKERADLLYKTCQECPHSTDKPLDPKQMDYETPLMAKAISTVGNALAKATKSTVMGLRCKKCGCDVKLKAYAATISGKCPDKGKNGVSRWQAALSNVPFEPKE